MEQLPGDELAKGLPADRTAVVDELRDAALALIDARHADLDGWAGAAAMLLADGSVVTSTAPEFLNGAVGLCHEVGALCEAYKRGVGVRASACVVRITGHGTRVLAPCGVCQERLRSYGDDVLVAVADPGDPSRAVARTLRQVQPYPWTDALPPDDL